MGSDGVKARTRMKRRGPRFNVPTGAVGVAHRALVEMMQSAALRVTQDSIAMELDAEITALPTTVNPFKQIAGRLMRAGVPVGATTIARRQINEKSKCATQKPAV